MFNAETITAKFKVLQIPVFRKRLLRSAVKGDAQQASYGRHLEVGQKS